ncbi:Uma2 family endonuclease [Pyxidicoccus sp. MSG2]|uniref:Uma2 family endonuclease n=1 Tax=Pyxidicoccus sp. MSG2 TaxID=2996790 RepID=UPI002270AAC8|nr:Uma2 family endonuclease [Pyxidicoccus sp. MSG2]MCY1019557.1 Uma2 family endonuclease [Pyxidicoccus sp. MSG2]
MSDKTRTEVAYEALERLPPNVVGEIIDGELYVRPHPGTVHVRAAGQVARALGPFDEEPEQEGPGGWFLLPKTELHLGGDVLVPDLVGWRRERMPEIPDVVGVELAPDWLCEVLSPSTENLDRTLKMAVYAREGVKHLWLVDPSPQTLEVYRLEGGSWLLLGTHAGSGPVRAEPFEAIPVDLAALWER